MCEETLAMTRQQPAQHRQPRHPPARPDVPELVARRGGWGPGAAGRGSRGPPASHRAPSAPASRPMPGRRWRDGAGDDAPCSDRLVDAETRKRSMSCHLKITSRRPGRPPTADMVWIPGGKFAMGSNDHYPEEAPAHDVTVDGFWMDKHTVANGQFRRFVEATGYVTVAERE